MQLSCVTKSKKWRKEMGTMLNEEKKWYEKAGKEIHGWTAGRYRIMGMTAEKIAEKRCYTVKEVQEMLGIRY